jgi:hypothetical protein
MCLSIWEGITSKTMAFDEAFFHQLLSLCTLSTERAKIRKTQYFPQKATFGRRQYLNNRLLIIQYIGTESAKLIRTSVYGWQ